MLTLWVHRFSFFQVFIVLMCLRTVLLLFVSTVFELLFFTLCLLHRGTSAGLTAAHGAVKPAASWTHLNSSHETTEYFKVFTLTHIHTGLKITNAAGG